MSIEPHQSFWWPGWKSIWHIHIPHKIQLLWKLVHGKLPTKDKLRLFIPSANMSCSLCGMSSKNETTTCSSMAPSAFVSGTLSKSNATSTSPSWTLGQHVTRLKSVNILISYIEIWFLCCSLIVLWQYGMMPISTPIGQLTLSSRTQTLVSFNELATIHLP